ncbi:DUF5007 domain-containing protein [Chitinophaga solisilvae]|uniref:DUF5007 domain-containing protein n=1 Tax=Chitinophaga solisilvae TaxID=1233460 RepID=A0A9Q5GVZ6_9BACT|nr:DUF5007 domain-containing protein [Chitinophaga solisilvae]NSL87803.1 DUF5007 domain-containing protein [Chitinophaga solisilvae]
MSNKYLWYRWCSLLLTAVLLAAGCKKIDEGFLSDGLYVPDSPIKIERGNPFQKTASILADGTTQPMTVKLLDIRRADNKKRADEFFREYNVYVYTAAIDPEKDTTIEQVNAKRVLKKMQPFVFLPSGQFVFNGATDSLPLGVAYEYDVEVSNVAGTRKFTNIGLMTTIDPPLFKKTSLGGCNWFQDFGTKNGSMGDLTFNITKVADTGTSVILKIADQFGKPFNPKKGEIIKRGDRPTFESYARFHPVVYTDTSMICNFEITPFPVREIPGYGGYLMYYRIPSNFVVLDNNIPGMEPGPNSVNPRFGFQIIKAGTYLVEIRLPKTTRK